MILFLALLSTLAAEAPSAEQLMARHVQAAGGEAALRKIVTVVRKGCFESQPGARCLPVETYSKAPGKWQFRLTVPDVLFFEQASSGSEAWEQGEEGPQDMKPEERRQLDYILDVQLALRAGEYFTGMKTAGSRKAGEREVWVVEAKPRGGDKPMELEFDAATGLLVRVAEVGFEDYRAVEGVQLPHTILVVEDRARQRIVAKELTANAAVEDWRFDREGSAAAYERDMRAMWLPQLDQGLRGIDAGPARAMFEKLHNFAPQDGRMLYDLIVERGYKRAIEVGTARGNSALWIALALKKTGGKLITIELNPELAKAANANFREAGLADVVECRNNDAFKEIPALEGEFDLLFLDTGTALHKKFMDLVYPARLKDGGAVVSHNANNFARNQPDFLKAITEDPKLDTKITRTPSGGMSISVKKPQS